MNEYKVCLKCNKIQLIEMFYRDISRKDGKHPYCKTCQKIRMDKYYHDNREKLILYQKQYSIEHADRKKAYQQRTFKQKQIYSKIWRQRQKQHIKNYKKMYHEKFEKNNINFRILHSLRGRLLLALKDNIKSKHTIELVGCNVEDLKKYLESKFINGMNWNNYGRRGWHIDHIIPCSSFDLSNPEEQRKCFHHTNLQPLWWIDNCVKSKY